jgi:hypothetical protein
VGLAAKYVPTLSKAFGVVKDYAVGLATNPMVWIPLVTTGLFKLRGVIQDHLDYPLEKATESAKKTTRNQQCA